MAAMKPGDTVGTPHGEGWLLYPLRRTRQREWMVIVGTAIHEVSVDEMAFASTRSEDTSKASTHVPKPRNLGQMPEEMSTGGTRQMEIEL